MSEVVFQAEPRTSTRKHAKYVRREGKVPGVYYMHGEENLNIQVSRPMLEPLIFTAKTYIINLQLADGSSRKCILRDVQFDPVADRPIHFDLQGLRENEKLTIEVPVVLVGGTPKGVRDGGLLQHLMHRIKVSCLPKNIPEKVELNVALLEINHSLHVSDLSVPNVTILENPGTPVAAVIPPALEKEPEVVAAAETPAEPEVLTKGKKAEEGEEGGEPPKAEAKAPGKESKEGKEGKEERKK